MSSTTCRPIFRTLTGAVTAYVAMTVINNRSSIMEHKVTAAIFVVASLVLAVVVRYFPGIIFDAPHRAFAVGMPLAFVAYIVLLIKGGTFKKEPKERGLITENPKLWGVLLVFAEMATLVSFMSS